ncbi:response regulator transcription factor [Desnuesiella massiliensis]|uniref:response regulator transcription factor n=1 Tax=Desnuesiella massiliensis TaxID=1650662 RepID=UPI0006E20115|nr:LuxR C-terminal-related transcriptional regulator [Desnuesiella massiliensis]
MLDNNDEFQKSLHKVLNAGSLKDVFDYMEENVVSFFSTPNIFKYYHMLKNIDISTSSKMMPVLTKAWLAFLSGDNAGFTATVKYIDEAELRGCYENSFYYSLKALTGFSIDHMERLKYAKLSIDILPKDDKGLFMANAKLTYGQILSGFDKYRDAAQMFDESFQIFKLLDMFFLAVVAFVNKALNKYKLGEVSYVIDECNKMLVTYASYKEEIQDYWNIIHLPLGMCYFDLNKPNLAIHHLKLAKSSIDKMNLLHMHGITELYLFKAYFILNDKTGMEDILKQSESDFGKMHYTMTDLLLSMFRIMCCKEENKKLIQPDIERFEVEYMKGGEKSPFILLETLGYLKLKGYSDLITIDDILESLKKLRFIGLVSYIQMFLVLLAEIHFIEDKQRETELCLKEAVSIYKEYGISANFYMFPMKSVDLLKTIDKKLYKILENKYISKEVGYQESLLSIREKEIMQHIALGKSNDEISKTLFISVGTVKWHINHIFSKLQVKNRVQAIDKAKTLGEIS